MTAHDTFLPPYKVEHTLGTLSQSQGWHIQQLRIPKTWEHTRGCDIKVMVLDTGCSDHPDLLPNIDRAASRSFLRNERDIIDFNGHQTHVMGIIGAADNEFGVVGVAPKCTMISCKVLGRDGSGDFRAIKNALRYAKQIRPHIINMSLGTHVHDPEIQFLIRELYDMNIPIICASGNDGRSNFVNYPAKYPETIAVTAYDSNGRPARFNSTGPQVDFSAPGVQVYSTWLNNTYAKLDGTSMATPVITGIVALLLSKHFKQELDCGENDCRTVEQIRHHLKKYSDRNGVIGRDNTWGYGIIDVKEAIVNPLSTDAIVIEEDISQPVRPNIFRRFWNWLTRR